MARRARGRQGGCAIRRSSSSRPVRVSWVSLLARRGPVRSARGPWAAARLRGRPPLPHTSPPVLAPVAILVRVVVAAVRLDLDEHDAET